MVLSNRTLLLAVSASCAALIGAALYAQQVLGMLPCPYCVLIRYVFILIGIFSLIAAFAPALQKKVSVLNTLFALSGAGMSAKLWYVQNYPANSCGVDPVENVLNKFILADWFPLVFKSMGFCETPYDPILGLSIPSWTLLGSLAFAGLFIWLAIRRQPGIR